MLAPRYGTFTGGIDLPEEKQATLDAPIRAPALPQKLQVPLAPCGGAPARSIVRPGQPVTAGQRIARADDPGTVDVFAPASGRVGAFTTVDVAVASGFAESPAVELTDLSPDGYPPAHEPSADWQSAKPDALRRHLTEGGLTTCRRPPEPLGPWIDRARRDGCVTLIANVMENQPYLTSDHRMLVECGRDLVTGLAILARALDVAEVFLAADRRRTSHYRHIEGIADLHGITTVALPHKYPIGAETILVKVLTRTETPPGGRTTSVGAAVISGAACLAVCRWVTGGIPLTHRVVTVSGPSARDAGNFLVPIGTPCAELAPAAHPLIHGGPMVGLACPSEAVVTSATDGLLAIECAEREPATPCLRCGWCTDHCPARLNVAALNDAYELGRLDLAERAGAKACVCCAVCSYVCPAKLPLSARVKDLKEAVTHAPRPDRL